MRDTTDLAETLAEHDTWFDYQRSMVAYHETPVDDTEHELQLRYYDGDVVDIIEVAGEEHNDTQRTLKGVLTLTPNERYTVREALSYYEDRSPGGEIAYFPTDPSIEFNGTCECLRVSIRRRNSDSEKIYLDKKCVEAVQAFLSHVRSTFSTHRSYNELGISPSEPHEPYQP